MRKRVEERRPSIHDRPLLRLALDTEGKRRALQDSAQCATGEAERAVGDRLKRHEVARVAPRRANHAHPPVTRTRGRRAYAQAITSHCRSESSPIRMTPKDRPISAAGAAATSRRASSPG